MRSAGDVDECKMEYEDGDDPPIDAGAGFEIWVSEHALDVVCIYFDYQVPNTNEVHFERSEGTEEAVELKLALPTPRMCFMKFLIMKSKNLAPATGLFVTKRRLSS